MPFDIGISGLNAATADLKTTGNNIANAGTIGFKSSRAEFSNIYSLSKNGAASTAIGSGVRVSSIAQQFTQGNISFTQNNLDLAINGDGFFTVRDTAGSQLYTRNGQFKVDNEGNIVTNDGYKLQGYQVDASGNTINTGEIGALTITTTQIAPQATTTSEVIANIDASSADASGNIDPSNPSTYHHTTSYTTYDSLGNSMLTSMYFQKNDTDPVGVWTVGVRTVDGVGNAIPANVSGNPETTDYLITFDTSGKLKTIDPGSGTAGAGISFDASGNAASPNLVLDYTGLNTPTGAAAQTINVDISKLSQYGANFSVNDLSQNGYTTGNLAGIEIDQTGIMLARFTNGQSNQLGQIILSGFANPQGLGQIGNNNWVQSFASGEPVVNVPGDGSLGLVTSGALEEANVDLTEDLINLIIAQRNFQANAKTITTADTITQTIINI